MLSVRTAPRWILLLLFGALCGLLFFYFLQAELEITGGRLGVPLDDTWIHFAFARNLVSGEGFSLVAGKPTPGSTAPLWTIMLAGIGLFTTDFLVPALILSSVFFAVIVLLTYGLSFELIGNWQIALLAALATAICGRLLWAGLSAMEVTFFTSLALGSVWIYQRRGLDWITALVLGLASQSRPEGHLLFLLMVADSLLSFRWLPRADAPKPGWRSLVAAIVVYSAVNLPYALFSYSTTGRPLPNTFYAKAEIGELFSWRTLQETSELHWRDNPLMFLLAPFGSIFLWKRSRVFIGWLFGLWVLIAFVLPFVWHYGRYTMPLIPFFMIAGAAGLFWWINKVPDHCRNAISFGTVVILLIGALALPDWADRLGTNVREVQEVDIEMAQWIAQHIPPEVTIAVDDIGAIGFHSPQPILDLHGLISPEAWSSLKDPDFTTAQVRLMAESGVQYMAIFPGWHQAIVENPQLVEPYKSFATDSHTIIGERVAAVYRVTWPYIFTSSPEHRRPVILSDIIQLEGYDFQSSEDGQSLKLTLYWQSLADIDENYKVFVHLLDEKGAIMVQSDRPPANGFAPTYRWRSDDLIRDQHTLDLPSNLPRGNYEIWAGLYTEEKGRLAAQGEDTQDNSIFLTEWRNE